ncbi:MAG: hypothetical protein EZS28_018570 [Streblomastix strix]|uniref:Uncharacterized protein n=1 Tax=Streblomastix strix TaxID=222440 RepID=A0A5J4VTB5_9EUKA|nr:MAG: hypothetical protein EZS28_018570 [Streblomastix strix]
MKLLPVQVNVLTRAGYGGKFDSGEYGSVLPWRKSVKKVSRLFNPQKISKFFCCPIPPALLNAITSTLAYPIFNNSARSFPSLQY